MARFLGYGLLIFLAAFLFYSPTDNTSWDPSFYYAQLRAPLIDRDLYIEDEVAPGNGIRARTESGLVPSPWPITPGVLWSPFFLLAHLVELARGAVADGRSSLYYAFVAAGSALFGLAGLAATWRAVRWVSHGAKVLSNLSLATLVTALVLFASPLFYYLFRQPMMAHTTGFWATALLLWAMVLVEARQLPARYSGLVVGACLGVAIGLRRIGVLLAVIPALYAGYYILAAWRAGDRARLRLIAAQAAVALAAAAVALLPQLAYYYQMFGTLGLHLTTDFGAPVVPVHLPEVLFSTNRGLLFWFPLALAGFVGLMRLPSVPLRVGLGGFVLVYLYGLALWRDWYGGAGFGARYFIEVLPVVAMGVAALAVPLARNTAGRSLLVVMAILLVVHQLVLVVTAEQGWLPADYGQGQPVELSFHVEVMRRVLAEPRWWVAARPYVLPERQSALVTALNGGREWNLFLFPAVAFLLWLTLGTVAWLSSHRRWIVTASIALLALMAAWGWWLAALPS